MLTNIHNNSIIKMTNQTNRFATSAYETCIIITDEEIFEGDTVEFKQSKKYMGIYKIYQDDDNIEGKSIYVCRIKRQITFQLRDDDGFRMKLLNVTHIDTNKIKSYKDIIEIESEGINIFDLILYLGLEIKQEWFDFSKLIEMMQLRRYFDNHRVNDVPRRELFDMFSNYVNEDNLEELNMMIDRYKFFIMSGNNDAYFLAALFGKGQPNTSVGLTKVT